jgi:hypothetical protein
MIRDRRSCRWRDLGCRPHECAVIPPYPASRKCRPGRP